MYTLIVCLAATAVHADHDDYGWQRMPDGEMQYIIQLDPQRLDALRDGRPIESDIPPGAGNVRSYRIVVGRDKLPHDKPAAEPTPRATSQPLSDGAKLTMPKLSPPAEAPSSLPLLTSEAARPLAERTTYMDPKAIPETKSAAVNLPAANEPEKPWLPLTLALLGLFASLGGNLYLGWIAWDATRFRAGGV